MLIQMVSPLIKVFIFLPLRRSQPVCFGFYYFDSQSSCSVDATMTEIRLGQSVSYPYRLPYSSSPFNVRHLHHQIPPTIDIPRPHSATSSRHSAPKPRHLDSSTIPLSHFVSFPATLRQPSFMNCVSACQHQPATATGPPSDCKSPSGGRKMQLR